MLGNIQDCEYLCCSLAATETAIRLTSFQQSATLMSVISQNILRCLNIHLQFLL